MLLFSQQAYSIELSFKSSDVRKQPPINQLEPWVDVKREYQEGEISRKVIKTEFKSKGNNNRIQVHRGWLKVITKDQVYCYWSFGQCEGTEIFQDKVQTWCVFEPE